MESCTNKMLEKSMFFLIETVGFEREEAALLIKEYIDSLDQELNLIESAIQSREFLLIMRSAHSLKGSSGNCNMNKIAELALDLEQTAKLGNIEECNEDFYSLNQCADELKLAYLKIIK